jgi:hypothetical protein
LLILLLRTLKIFSIPNLQPGKLIKHITQELPSRITVNQTAAINPRLELLLFATKITNLLNLHLQKHRLGKTNNKHHSNKINYQRQLLLIINKVKAVPVEARLIKVKRSSKVEGRHLHAPNKVNSLAINKTKRTSVLFRKIINTPVKLLRDKPMD